MHGLVQFVAPKHTPGAYHRRRRWTASGGWATAIMHQGAGASSVFKTMWKMPAKLLRCRAVDGSAGEMPQDEPIASGSLEEMIKAADALGAQDGAAEDARTLVIKCVGRDRPITWSEITGLRNAATFASDI